MASRKQPTEKFEVHNRFTNAVQFTATISCAPDATIAVKLGLAVRWAYKNDADLRGAYLRGAYLSECPVKIPDIHKAVYEAASAPGALDMADWHRCETTHCRAGWVVTLAGDAGKALEWAMGTPAAASMIYLASDPKLEKMPDFYADNETALANMKALAELEAAQ